MKEILPGLPDDARVFIFGFEKPLKDEEKKQVGTRVEAFLSSWTSHENSVEAASQILYDRFLILGAVSGLSGCSIDKSVHLMQEIRDSRGLNALNYDLVFYRENSAIKSVKRGEFETLSRNKSVSPSTIVFDNTVQKLGDVRAGHWETPAEQSWHARAFFRKVPGLDI